MALFRGRKVPGFLGLSMLFSVGAAAGGRYNGDCYEEEEELVAFVDVSTLCFTVFLPYDGREDSAVTEVHIGHNLIGDN